MQNKTYRSKAYMKFVKGLFCVADNWICDGKEIHAHHAGKGGTGIKATDLSCIPLCSWHHANLHGHGKKTFEDSQGIDLKDQIIKANHTYIKHLEEELEYLEEKLKGK